MNYTADKTIYIGVNDHQVDLFEGLYIVPGGMAYNSYVILDEKVAVMDTIEAHFGDEWLANLEEALGGRTPDYLVVQHMEPDHSANIARFMEKYPQASVCASAPAFKMMLAYFGSEYADRRVIIKDGDTLSLGSHTLHFVTAPFVHWPEVVMTYDDGSKALFSADAFGKFGALDYDDPEGWACEARRYYFGIVGKFGKQVQDLLAKIAASGFEIQTICPLHGPVLTEDLGYYLDIYNTWSSYGVESEGVCICYTTVYGHTREAAEYLAEKLEAKGVKVALNDLARCDVPEAVEDAFRYGKLVLATTTYNGGMFPVMKRFIDDLTERNYQNRTLALIENGSWGPMAAKKMAAEFENSKNITYAAAPITIKAALTEANKQQLDALADALA